MRDRITVLRWGNALAFAVLLGMNALANLAKLGGVTTGQVSAAYPNLFTPAPVTFAVWGVIYLLLAGFVVWQTGALHDWTSESRTVVEKLGWWFVASCLLNAGWLVAWHFDQIGLSTLLIAGLLVVLAVLVGKTRKPDATKLDWLLWQAPFSLYFGWITVATIANVTVWLTKRGWNGWGIAPATWMLVVLTVGALIAIAAILRNRDWVYGLAVVWAYAGILLRQLSSDGFGGAYPAIVVTVCLCIAALLTAMGRAIWDARRDRGAAR